MSINIVEYNPKLESAMIDVGLKGYNVVTTVRVCGGFPVIAAGNFYPGDDSVGWGDELTEEEVFSMSGGNASFIKKKMTKDDWANVHAALSKSLSESQEEDF